MRFERAKVLRIVTYTAAEVPDTGHETYLGDWRAVGTRLPLQSELEGLSAIEIMVLSR